jgi:hypothetical protein
MSRRRSRKRFGRSARVHQSFIISYRQRTVHRETKIAVANQGRRFAQNPGFGEPRCGAKSLTMKIFLLPKTATQSPRSGPLAGLDQAG